MKLASIKLKSTGRPSVAAVTEKGLLDLHAASDGQLPATMMEFLQQGDSAMQQARKLAENPEGAVLSEDDFELLAPVPRPGKILHTSCNFSAHLDELTTWQDPEWQSHEWGKFHFEHPTGFLEAPSSVVPHNAKVAVPHFTKQLDYEVEVGIIIGREAFRVSRDDALDYVAGLTVFNDLSARDIQSREHSNNVVLLGKSFNGSCPLGPYLVTVDEIDDVDDMSMVLKLNGEERQNSSTAHMVYKVRDLVAWWSNTTLEPGDLITTGSPPGVIAGMKDTPYLAPGDRIDATVESLGTLTTFIV